MKKFLSMAALALVGAIMTGCSSDDDSIISNPQQPENKSKVVTLTTTVGLDGGATTRALTPSGVKTFAEGDQIAVIYKNTSDKTIKTVSTISTGAGTATATFSVELTDPDNTKAIRYIYPAAMAKATVAEDATIDDDGTVDFTKLDSQDGTLATLGGDLDLCVLDAADWSSGTLPTGTLANQLAILAIAVKNSDGSNELTGSITGLTVNDGTNTYSVTRSAVAGPIYVAIQPTTSADISVTATDGTQSYHNYGKFLTGKTYEASNGYSVSWKMLPRVDLSAKSGSYNVTRNEILTGTPSGNLTIGYSADNWEVTLDNVNPSGSKDVKISSGRNVNLKLKGTSRLTQIFANNNKNVTIDKAADDGTLILQMGATYAPLDVFGTVYIKGGTVKARNTGNYYAVYSNLNITGGAVYLAGGGYQKAVNGSVTGTLYGWNGSWGSYSSQQYATTDNTSGNPSSWTW